MSLRHFAAAAALIVGSAAVTTVLSQDKGPAPTRLGFLDVRKALDGYRKQKEVAEQLKNKKDDFIKELRRAGNELDKMVDSLNTMNPGTPEYADLEKRIMLLKGSIDVEKKFKTLELESEQRRKHAAMYREICDEAQAIQAERGLAAVLSYLLHDKELMDQDLTMIVLTRAVICRDDQLDVTDEIVSRLNAQLPPPQTPQAPKSPTPDPTSPSSPPSGTDGKAPGTDTPK